MRRRQTASLVDNAVGACTFLLVFSVLTYLVHVCQDSLSAAESPPQYTLHNNPLLSPLTHPKMYPLTPYGPPTSSLGTPLSPLRAPYRPLWTPCGPLIPPPQEAPQPRGLGRGPVGTLTPLPPTPRDPFGPPKGPLQTPLDPGL
jgi:hypothetical protein